MEMEIDIRKKEVREEIVAKIEEFREFVLNSVDGKEITQFQRDHAELLKEAMDMFAEIEEGKKGLIINPKFLESLVCPEK